MGNFWRSAVAKTPHGAPMHYLTKWVPAPKAMNEQNVRAAVDISLRRMKTESLDMLQFHWWEYDHPGYKDALQLLADMKTRDGSQKLVRNLALTNFDTKRCRELVELGVPIVSNQVQFSLLDRRPLNAMVPYFEEHGAHLRCILRFAPRSADDALSRAGVKILAYGVLAGGFLTDRYLGQPPPRSKPETASLGKYLKTIQQAGGWGQLQRVLSACRRIADRHGVSIANVATRWVLEQPTVAAAIIGARLGHADAEHIQENLAALTFELDATDHAELDAVFAEGEMLPGDCGDEYRR